MGKHTQGPWTLETVNTSCGSCHKIGPFPSNGPYGVTHACVYAHGEYWLQDRLTVTGKELLANARLIAAAPDLLEALEDLVSSTHALEYDLLGEEIRRARAAIAKAKGETE